MKTIYNLYLETELIEKDKFELMQSVLSGSAFLSRFLQATQVDKFYETDDRMLAAIMNLGHACKFVEDTNFKCDHIILKTDIDGKDFRYDKEHNVLVSLMNPKDDFEARKHISIYGAKYGKYLHRIQHYINEYRLIVKIDE